MGKSDKHIKEKSNKRTKEKKYSSSVSSEEKYSCSESISSKSSTSYRKKSMKKSSKISDRSKSTSIHDSDSKEADEFLKSIDSEFDGIDELGLDEDDFDLEKLANQKKKKNLTKPKAKQSKPPIINKNNSNGKTNGKLNKNTSKKSKNNNNKKTVKKEDSDEENSNPNCSIYDSDNNNSKDINFDQVLGEDIPKLKKDVDENDFELDEHILKKYPDAKIVVDENKLDVTGGKAHAYLIFKEGNNEKYNKFYKISLCKVRNSEYILFIRYGKLKGKGGCPSIEIIGKNRDNAIKAWQQKFDIKYKRGYTFTSAEDPLGHRDDEESI